MYYKVTMSTYLAKKQITAPKEYTGLGSFKPLITFLATG